MTEAEWEATHFPGTLLTAATERTSVRKRRLVAVTAVRLLPPDVLGEHANRVLGAAERLAEYPDVSAGPMVRKLFSPSLQRRLWNRPGYRDGLSNAITCLLLGDAQQVVQSLGLATGRIDPHGEFEHRDMHLSDLIRDILGPQVRPAGFDPAWHTPTVEAIAAGAYADRAFDRLPVLADALEDVGCDAADLLAHLRGPGPHARGCWALDLVLGKT